MGCAKFSFDSLHLSPSHFFFLSFFCNIGKLVIYEAENGEGTENCLGFFKVWPISGSKWQERKKGSQDARDKEVIFQPNHPQNLQPN